MSENTIDDEYEKLPNNGDELEDSTCGTVTTTTNLNTTDINTEDNLTTQNETQNETQNDRQNKTQNDRQNETQNDIYVISINNEPFFYVDNYDDGLEYMWKYARQLMFEEQLFDKCHINQANHNELHIIHIERFYIMSYEEVLHRVNINAVKKLNKVL